LEGRIADTAQQGDFVVVKKLSEELQDVVARIDKKTDRWLELAERAEAAGMV
jgi:hypothetical protein